MKAISAIIEFTLSLRGLVALFALIILSPQQVLVPDSLDSIAADVASRFFLQQQQGTNIAVIEIPGDQINYLLNDPTRAGDTISLLGRLERTRGQTVTVLLPRLPRLEPLTAELLLRDWKDEKLLKGNAAVSQASGFIDRQKRLKSLLSSKKVFLGIPAKTYFVDGVAPTSVVASEEPAYFKYIPAVVKPLVPSLKPEAAKLHSWPYAIDEQLEVPLLWRQKDELFPTLLLKLTQQLNASSSLSWKSRVVVGLDNISIQSGADGRVLTKRPDAASVEAYSLKQALQKLPKAKMILLGEQDSQQLHNLAAELRAIESGDYLYQPIWFFAAEKLLVVLALCLLLFVIPRMTSVAALLTLLLVSILMVSTQQFFAVIKLQWLPFGNLLTFIWVAYFLMYFWANSQRRWQTLRSDSQRVHLQLAGHWQQQGRLRDALDCLQHCSATEEYLELSYRIAVEQERKRQYDDAADTYSMIASYDRKYKEASQRAQMLKGIKHPDSAAGSDLSLSHTLVMPGGVVSQPVLGRYEIEREIGRGAMGVVYLGTDPKIARRVAIKTLNYNAFDDALIDSLKERFFREAEAAGRLDHPNIVTIYDVGEERDLAYIAMDYVEGNPVSRYASESTLLPTDQVYSLIAKVAEALSYAHQQSIVHRDIKPGNIMYNPDNGQVKVADFGIARIIDDSKTKTGDVLGSPIYMSPEQLKGSKVSGASDIYSLGVTFYQLLSGCIPYSGDSIANLAYQIVNKKYKSVRELRPDLPVSAARIVNKAMKKDPAKRYANAGEMAEALRKSLARDFAREKV